MYVTPCRLLPGKRYGSLWVIVGHCGSLWVIVGWKNQCSSEIILIVQPFGSLWIIVELIRRARSTYGISSRFGGHCGSLWVIACFTNTRDSKNETEGQKKYSTDIREESTVEVVSCIRHIVVIFSQVGRLSQSIVFYFKWFSVKNSFRRKRNQRNWNRRKWTKSTRWWEKKKQRMWMEWTDIKREEKKNTPPKRKQRK